MYKYCLFSLVVLAAFSFNKAALAYLDPGTGSMLLQLLLGGVAGALVVGKLYWQRLKDMFSGSQRTDGSGAAPTQDTKQPDRSSH